MQCLTSTTLHPKGPFLTPVGLHFCDSFSYWVNHRLIHSNVETVNYEFLSKMKASNPNLTQNELKLISLLRLKLSTKEIASIKNISPDSVKVLRYRLRKKLSVPKDKNLFDFLIEIE